MKDIKHAKENTGKAEMFKIPDGEWKLVNKQLDIMTSNIEGSTLKNLNRNDNDTIKDSSLISTKGGNNVTWVINMKQGPQIYNMSRETVWGREKKSTEFGPNAYNAVKMTIDPPMNMGNGEMKQMPEEVIKEMPDLYSLKISDQYILIFSPTKIGGDANEYMIMEKQVDKIPDGKDLRENIPKFKDLDKPDDMEAGPPKIFKIPDGEYNLVNKEIESPTSNFEGSTLKDAKFNIENGVNVGEKFDMFLKNMSLISSNDGNNISFKYTMNVPSQDKKINFTQERVWGKAKGTAFPDPNAYNIVTTKIDPPMKMGSNTYSELPEEQIKEMPDLFSFKISDSQILVATPPKISKPPEEYLIMEKQEINNETSAETSDETSDESNNTTLYILIASLVVIILILIFMLR